MLLDEPTSNLDSLNEGVILKALAEEHGKRTVVLVSHRLSTLGIAGRLYTLRSGRMT
jgi:ABC-type bacteriocin/lantibiotic exporter with double-glycine peptidase domain